MCSFARSHRCYRRIEWTCWWFSWKFGLLCCRSRSCWIPKLRGSERIWIADDRCEFQALLQYPCFHLFLLQTYCRSCRLNSRILWFLHICLWENCFESVGRFHRPSDILLPDWCHFDRKWTIRHPSSICESQKYSAKAWKDLHFGTGHCIGDW